MMQALSDELMLILQTRLHYSWRQHRLWRKKNTRDAGWYNMIAKASTMLCHVKVQAGIFRSGIEQGKKKSKLATNTIYSSAVGNGAEPQRFLLAILVQVAPPYIPPPHYPRNKSLALCVALAELHWRTASRIFNNNSITVL